MLGQIGVGLGRDGTEDPGDPPVGHLERCGDPIGGAEGAHRVRTDTGLCRNQGRSPAQPADAVAPDLDHVVDLLIVVEPAEDQDSGDHSSEGSQQGVGGFGEVLKAALGEPDQGRGLSRIHVTSYRTLRHEG